MVGHANCEMRDVLPFQQPGDDLAERVAFEPKRRAKRTAQGGRIAGSHAAQVIQPAHPVHRTATGNPCTDFPLEIDPASRTGPIGRHGDLDRVPRGIGQFKLAATGEPQTPVHALVNGRPPARLGGDQRAIHPEHAVQVGWTEDRGAKIHDHSRLAGLP